MLNMHDLTHCNFNRVFDSFDREMQAIESEMDKIFYSHREVPAETKTITPVKAQKAQFYYQPTASSEKTFIRVGNSRMSCLGSLSVFADFMQKLISHEAEKINRHTRLIHDLQSANVVVKRANEIQESIKSFISEIMTHKNDLMLLESTEQVKAQRSQLEEMLQKLRALALPKELTEKSVEAFAAKSTAMIEEMQIQFRNLQGHIMHRVRRDVQNTAIQGQALIEETKEQTELKEAVSATTDKLQEHMARLGIVREKLFRLDSGSYATHEELRQAVVHAQDVAHKVKQMEIDALFLMRKAPPSPVFKKADVEKYCNDAQALIANHEAGLRDLQGK